MDLFDFGMTPSQQVQTQVQMKQQTSTNAFDFGDFNSAPQQQQPTTQTQQTSTNAFDFGDFSSAPVQQQTTAASFDFGDFNSAPVQTTQTQQKSNQKPNDWRAKIDINGLTLTNTSQQKQKQQQQQQNIPQQRQTLGQWQSGF